MSSRNKSRNSTFLPGYASSLDSADAKKRYQEKLAMMGGFDPYESSRSDWEDDVDKCQVLPAST
jgi:hypothetical protein